MLRSLHARLALVLLALLAATGAAYVGATLVTTARYQREVSQAMGWDLARHIAAAKHETLLGTDGAVRPEGLEELFHWLMVVNPAVEFYLLDPEGRLLAFDAAPGVVELDRVDLGPVERALAAGAHPPILGDDPRNPGQRKVFSVAPLPPEGPTAGYLYIVLASELYDTAAERFRHSYILRLSAALALGGLALAALVGALAFRRLTRPLRRLAERMRAFRLSDGSGAAAARPPPPADDEVAELGASFDALAQRVEAEAGERERLERQRRELIANVSHDLRTPIAALRGYLDTLALKGGALAAAEREEYLAIAQRQAERLGRLVGELFELTKLESGEAEPEHERFSLAELVQDNLQRFALPAERRGVRLAAELDPALPPVEGDIAMVERVLENLLDNALRHTPREGRVTVGLAVDGPRLRVRVVDSGCGIAAADLPHVFDRYFSRPGNGDGGDGAAAGTSESGGAGLGLAISRRIVELHGGAITVDSTPGRGTAVSFSLPLA